MNTEPFRWWCFDDAVGCVPLGCVPHKSATCWEASYDNDCEHRKRTLRDVERHAHDLLPALTKLRSMSCYWSEELGYPVRDDPVMHGGGLHVTEPGGWLNTHIDYALHPDGEHVRALNVIAFVHEKWDRQWGGELQLCDGWGKPVVELESRPGRVVAFEVSDLSLHGVAPLSADACERVSLAVYYLTELCVKRGCDEQRHTRRRAMFLPKRS